MTKLKLKGKIYNISLYFAWNEKAFSLHSTVTQHKIYQRTNGPINWSYECSPDQDSFTFRGANDL